MATVNFSGVVFAAPVAVAPPELELDDLVSFSEPQPTTPMTTTAAKAKMGPLVVPTSLLSSSGVPTSQRVPRPVGVPQIPPDRLLGLLRPYHPTDCSVNMSTLVAREELKPDVCADPSARLQLAAGYG
jgi:hypothetical protein